jgi:uracil-DNA glycosylase
MADPKMHESWLSHLKPEFDAPYMAELRSYLLEQKQQGPVFPPGPDIFTAFNLTPLDKVRVVILGQDPYIRPGQAHGLCFSVRPPTRPPPSLQNIFKELKDDVGFVIPAHGDLSAWARQGVLLLNAVLTVREGESFSHANRGWERFTDRAIELVATQREGVVFLLWGRPAQEKAGSIDRVRHNVLMCAHPSPMSATRGFFGCRHFSKTNAWLKARGDVGIDWQI